MAGSFLIDDLNALLNTDDFAVVGELFPASGDSREITGIFDDEDVEIDNDGHIIFMRSARLQVKTCEGVAEGDTLIIAAQPPVTAGGDFRVAVTQDDGTGMTTLHLEKVPT